MAAKKTSTKKTSTKKTEPKAGRRISTAGPNEGDANEDPPAEESEKGTDDASEEAAASEKPKLDATSAAAAGLRRNKRPKIKRPVEGVYAVVGGIRYTPKGGGGVVEVHASDDPDAPNTVDDLTDADIEHFLEHGVIKHHVE